MPERRIHRTYHHSRYSFGDHQGRNLPERSKSGNSNPRKAKMTVYSPHSPTGRRDRPKDFVAVPVFWANRDRHDGRDYFESAGQKDLHAFHHGTHWRTSVAYPRARDRGPS